MLLSSLGGGCTEPTCQTACEKSFQNCGMSQIYANLDSGSPPPSLEQQIQACVTACSSSMLNDESAGDAAGWVSCVDTFVCTGESDWTQLCLTCDAGYFKGASSGSTCNATAETATFQAW